MYCPYCGSDQQYVLNSRSTAKNTQVWRRRKCGKCEEVFTTYEKINLSFLKVEKRSGEVQMYNRAKLFSGIFSSSIEGKSRDRGEMGAMSEKITQEVEREILALKRRKLKSTEILDIVLDVLKKRSLQIFLQFLAYREGGDEKRMKVLIKRCVK